VIKKNKLSIEIFILKLLKTQVSKYIRTALILNCDVQKYYCCSKIFRILINADKMFILK